MYKNLSLFFIVAVSACFAEQNYQEYLDLLQKYPQTLGPVGHADLGEIELVLDPQKMEEIALKMQRKVGIIAEDRYWIWLNDAVKFPFGKEGVYGRIIWKNSLKNPVGVAVMPILSDGRIVLNYNFRHATRSWEFELPRGAMEWGESVEHAAMRETKEETGMVVDHLYFLGNMAIDTGFTNSVVPIIMAKVVGQEASTPEESEAIADVIAFSREEIEEGLIKGFLEVSINGEKRQAPLRDPFLAFALLQAKIQQLIE